MMPRRSGRGEADGIGRGGAARKVDHVSYGRVDSAPRVVPADTRCHRDAAPVATGSMLSAAAVTGRVGCRQGNCAHLPPHTAEPPVRQQSPTDDAGRARPPGTFPVARPVRSRVVCLSEGQMGRSSGECRIRWTGWPAGTKSATDGGRSQSSSVFQGRNTFLIQQENH